jgi:hypothetical protein
MPARRLTDLTIVIGSAVAVTVLVIAAAFIAPSVTPLDKGTSSHSAGPRGAKAAYLTLAALGYRVERSIEPITALRIESSAATLILSGREALSEQDRRALKQFVEAGGTLLAVGTNGAASLGLAIPPDTRSPFDAETIEPFQPLTTSPLSRGAGEITMASGGTSPKFSEAFVRLYGDADDTTVVAVATMGEGRAVWFSETTPFSNRELTKADNLRLLLNVVGPPQGRVVLFDEHYQGMKRSLWSYLTATSLPWIGAQAALLFVAVLLTHSRRVGPVRPPHTDARTSPMEFVDMLAALYKRAHARPAAVHAARTRLRRAIAVACSVPLATDDDTLARAAGAKLHTDPAPIAQLLADADRAAADAQLDSAQALEVMRRLQALAKKLEARS